MPPQVSAALLRFPNAEDVSEESGLLVPTHVGISTIPQAGIGRFLDVDVKKGEVIRIQKIGTPSLDAFDCVAALEYQLSKDGLKFIVDFGHVGPQDNPKTHGLLFINNPPLYSNHSTGQEMNMETVWEGDVKFI